VFAELAQDPGASETSTRAKSADTVSTKFKTSLAQLMDTISKTSTQYVRCIKPNKVKSPSELDNNMVVEQLRCAGVIEAIKVSRAGFPARMTLKEFLQRFSILANAAAGLIFARGRAVVSSDAKAEAAAKEAVAMLKAKASDPTAACRALVAALVPAEAKGEKGMYEVGRTRVYFKSGVLETLEERRALLMQAAATEIGRCVRGAQARRLFLRQRQAVLMLQAAQRMHRKRAVFLKLRRAVVHLQERRRAQLARRRRSATRIQCAQRRRVAMQTLRRARRAAVKVQAAVRQRACRRQYLIDLAESKEQAKLENQVRALQAKLAAQEAAFAQRLQAESSAEPVAGQRVETPKDDSDASKELQETMSMLKALEAENQKLRLENQKQKEELSKLRDENRHLKDDLAAKSGQLQSMQRDHKQKQAHAADASPEARAISRQTSNHSQETSAAGAGLSSPAPNATSWLYKPMSNFWQDVECCMIPFIKDKTEVHMKMGPNIVMVDPESKHCSLVWMPCMRLGHGYRRYMSFIIESPAATTSEDHSIGDSFLLRSTHTQRYVTVHREVLKGFFLRATAAKQEEASIFTVAPLAPTSMSNGVGLGDEVGTAAEHLFALRLQSDSKVMKLSTDGHVTMSDVKEADINIRNTRITASLEMLLARDEYEIEVQQPQIGIVLSKATPLRVVDLASWPVNRPNGPPALTSGRVHAGDILSSVSGQDVRGIPCNDVLDMIACKRPVTLGFTVPGPADGLPASISSISRYSDGQISPVKKSAPSSLQGLANHLGFGKRSNRSRSDEQPPEPAKVETISI